MASCTLRFCVSRSRVDNKQSTGITFHRFPKDADRRILWINFVGRPHWEPSKYCTLCSRHFCEEYFDRTSLSYVRLRDNAVPTLHRYQDVRCQQPSVSCISAAEATPSMSSISSSAVSDPKNFIQEETIDLLEKIGGPKELVIQKTTGSSTAKAK